MGIRCISLPTRIILHLQCTFLLSPLTSHTPSHRQINHPPTSSLRPWCNQLYGRAAYCTTCFESVSSALLWHWCECWGCNDIISLVMVWQSFCPTGVFKRGSSAHSGHETWAVKASWRCHTTSTLHSTRPLPGVCHCFSLLIMIIIVTNNGKSTRIYTLSTRCIYYHCYYLNYQMNNSNNTPLYSVRTRTFSLLYSPLPFSRESRQNRKKKTLSANDFSKVFPWVRITLQGGAS